MKAVHLELSELVVSEDLSRSGRAKQFEERLKSSIEEIGLVEPIKVALLPTGKYVVIDGIMRLKAIAALRETDPAAFSTIPAYVMDYDRRYELRYQTDIYQDLLPSQLAELVEHLHQTEHVHKADIARYIGVSPVTLRNYTGLWRLLHRGGLFAKVVELMDIGVVPSSNPYAWLRLTTKGLRYVLEHAFSNGEGAESWIEQCVLDARRGNTIRFTIKFVEAATDGLPAEYYRQGEELRTVKRDLGLRRAGQPQMVQLELVHPDEVQPEEAQPEEAQPEEAQPEEAQPEEAQPEEAQPEEAQPEEAQPEEAQPEEAQPELVQPEVLPRPNPVQQKPDTADAREAIKYLSHISHRSPDPVLRTAAYSLQAYLQ